MKFNILYLLLIFSFLMMPLANAQCLDVQIPRSSYFSGETFQAEITGEFLKPLTIDNFGFYQNSKEYYPLFTLTQMSSNKWILFFDVPKNYGENQLKVHGVLCKNQILKEESKSLTFAVQKPIDDLYSEAISSVSGKLSSMDVETSALAILALSYDEKTVTDGKNAILSKSNGGKCFPSDCNVKDTSLAILALDGINLTDKTINPKNWLLDSENNVRIGLWSLSLQSSSSQQCNLTINSNSKMLPLNPGANSFDLELPEDPLINISVSCPLQNAQISHTYLGSVSKFPLDLNLSITLNNQKCWGEKYRTSCNPLSTAYAIWALKGSMPNELSWLNQNAQSTEEKAFSYLFGNSVLSEYFSNNQAPDGFFANYSLAVSNIPDVMATVSSLRAISGVQKQMGEEWLLSNFGSMSLKEKLLSLQIFSQEKIEPLISLSQGFFKAPSESNITLFLTNRGVREIIADVSIGEETKSASILPSSRIEMPLVIPNEDELTYSYILIKYKNPSSDSSKTYSVPIIVYPRKYTPQQVNSLLQTPTDPVSMGVELSFLEKSVNQTIPMNEMGSIILNIKNSGKLSRNITIVASGLYGIIGRVEPSDFSLDSNEIRRINITLDSSKGFGDYEGTIQAETIGASISIPAHVSILQSAVSENKTNTVKPTKKSSNKWIGWMMVVLAFLIAGGYFYFKLRKKTSSPLLDQLKRIKTEPMNYLQPPTSSEKISRL